MRKNLIRILIFVSIYIFAPFIITLCMSGNKGKETKPETEGNVDSRKTSVPEYSSVTEFVTGTVAAYYEAGKSAEFLKVMAVVARTYVECIEKNGAESIPADFALLYMTEQEMRKEWQQNYEKNKQLLDSIVSEAADKVITMNGSPIIPFVHRISAGSTRNGREEYLNMIKCEEDIDAEEYLTKVRISEAELEKRLKNKYGKLDYGDSAVGSIQILSRDEAGYIIELMAGGITMTGDELADIASLPSSNFSVGREGDECIFVVRGKGSGYGISLYDADKKATAGMNYMDIINCYFKNIAIENV